MGLRGFGFGFAHGLLALALAHAAGHFVLRAVVAELEFDAVQGAGAPGAEGLFLPFELVEQVVGGFQGLVVVAQRLGGGRDAGRAFGHGHGFAQVQLGVDGSQPVDAKLGFGNGGRFSGFVRHKMGK